MTRHCPKCKTDFKLAPGTRDAQPVHCPLCGMLVPGLPDERRAGAAPAESSSGDLGTTPSRGGHYMPVKMGDVLSGFRLEEMLGAGAMAVVYRATQLSLQRPVALKILPERFADNAAFVSRFDKESSALAALNHPHIVTIIDRGRSDRTYFFAMEYVDGPTLRQVMKQGLAPRALVRIIRQVCSALEYAHSRGVVHRDIKPGNIMINSSNDVKIADFGLAGLMSEGESTGSGPAPRRMGTRGYMAPEQIASPLTVDGRADLYSFGVVLYQILTGRMPDPPPILPPSAISDDADPRLDPIVERCLEPDKEKRYPSAAALLDDIAKYEAEIALAPECPACGRENPVRAKACKHCGESLEKFFDLCPKCGSENRVDVRRCLECHSRLKESREKTLARTSKLFERVRDLAEKEEFDEALSLIGDIASIQGKAFAGARRRAEEMQAKLIERRKSWAERKYQEGQALFEAGRVAEAIGVWKLVPPEVLDLSKTIRQAEEWQRELEAVDEARGPRVHARPKAEPPAVEESGPPPLPASAEKRPPWKRQPVRLGAAAGAAVIVLLLVLLTMTRGGRDREGDRPPSPGQLAQAARKAVEDRRPRIVFRRPCSVFTPWTAVEGRMGRWSGNWVANSTPQGRYMRVYDEDAGRMVAAAATIRVPSFTTIEGAVLTLYARYNSPTDCVALEALGDQKGSASSLAFRLTARHQGKQAVAESFASLDGITPAREVSLVLIIADPAVVALADGRPVAMIEDAAGALPPAGRLAHAVEGAAAAWRGFKYESVPVVDETRTDQAVLECDPVKGVLEIRNRERVPVTPAFDAEYVLSGELTLAADKDTLPRDAVIALGRAVRQSGDYHMELRSAGQGDQVEARWAWRAAGPTGVKNGTGKRLPLKPGVSHRVRAEQKDRTVTLSIDDAEVLRFDVPFECVAGPGPLYLSSSGVLSSWRNLEIDGRLTFE